MRQLFVNILKLIGAYLIFESVIHFSTFVDVFIKNSFDSFFEIFLGFEYLFFVRLLIGLYLLFKAEFTSRILNIPDKELKLNLEPAKLIRIGITLIGFYFFILNYKSFTNIIEGFVGLFDSSMYYFGYIKYIANVFIITIPLLVVLSAKGLANRIVAYQDKRSG